MKNRMNSSRCTPLQRLFRMGLAVFLVTQLSGCATFLVLIGNGSLFGGSEPLVSEVSEQVLVMEDELVALGHPKSSARSDSALIAIVGKKNTYVMDKGGEQLQHIISSLDRSLIRVGYNEQPIEFNLSSAQDAQGNAVQLVKGTVRIAYNKPEAQLTAAELTQLKQLNFSVSPKLATGYIDFSGYVYPPANNLSEIQTQFLKSYPIKFSKTVTHTEHDVLRIVALPFAVGFDVVTFPLQFLFFATQ